MKSWNCSLRQREDREDQNEMKNKYDKQKIKSIMIDINPTISIITLKTNGLNILLQADILRWDINIIPKYILPTGN